MPKPTASSQVVLAEDIVVPGSADGTKASEQGAVLSSKFVNGPWLSAIVSAFGANVNCVREADCTTMAARPAGALHVHRIGIRNPATIIPIPMGLGRWTVSGPRHFNVWPAPLF